MPVFVAFEMTQQAPCKSCLNDAASRNMSFMLTTLEGCHFEMSPLNDEAPRNIPDMSLTFDTSHSAMEEIDNALSVPLKHFPKAPLSSAVDRGTNAVRTCK